MVCFRCMMTPLVHVIGSTNLDTSAVAVPRRRSIIDRTDSTALDLNIIVKSVCA